MNEPLHSGDHVEMTDEAICCGLNRQHRGAPTSGIVMRADPERGLVTVVLNGSGNIQVYRERFWCKAGVAKTPNGE